MKKLADISSFESLNNGAIYGIQNDLFDTISDGANKLRKGMSGAVQGFKEGANGNRLVSVPRYPLGIPQNQNLQKGLISLEANIRQLLQAGMPKDKLLARTIEMIDEWSGNYKKFHFKKFHHKSVD